MKKLLYATSLLLIVFILIGCANDQSEIESLVYVNELNNTLTEDHLEFDTWNESYPMLTQYKNEIQEIHLMTQTLKHELRTIVTDIQTKRVELQAQEIKLSDIDRDILIQRLKNIRFNQAMMNDSIGQGYQQLVYIKENRDSLNTDTIKTIVIDVYQTLNARLQYLENIYQDLSIIQSILINY